MGNYIYLALVIISFYGLSKLFVKAGEAAWKGFVPFYNFYVLSKLLNETLVVVFNYGGSRR